MKRISTTQRDAAQGMELNGADESSVEAFVETGQQILGRLDGLHVNFASFADGNSGEDVLGLSLDTFDEMVATNMRGYLLCTRAVLPRLIEGGGGAIVYTTSIGAIKPKTTIPFYAMTKAAGHALMRHVAFTFGEKNIRANMIAPGVVMHPKLSESVPESFTEIALQQSALKTRLGDPNDIASVGALLFSQDGSYITGQVIAVDGGITMN